MSKTWKGWLARQEAKDPYCVTMNTIWHRPNEATRRVPVLVTTIDDESLPHPGDGKSWRWSSQAEECEILTAPFGEHPTRVGIRCAKGYSRAAFVHDLRERKPKPEHRPWCKADPKTTWQRSRVAGHNVEPLPCTCERRSGEERRKYDRRVYDGKPNWDERLNRGRRSGTDRRQTP